MRGAVFANGKDHQRNPLPLREGFGEGFGEGLVKPQPNAQAQKTLDCFASLAMTLRVQGGCVGQLLRTALPLVIIVIPGHA